MRIYKLLSFFAGFFVSSVIDTTLGELNEWAIVGAAIVIASFETTSKFFYIVITSLWVRKRTNSYIVDLITILNSMKVGIIYGLIVDAFKLGS